jgi:hypothetical protein
MNSSSNRFPWETSDSPLGPAVPGADAAEPGALPPDDALPEPLAPFRGGEAVPAGPPAEVSDAASAMETAADQPLDEPDDEQDDGLEDIPWLLPDEMQDQDEPESLEAPNATEAPAAQPTGVAGDDESPFSMVDLEPFEAAPNDPGEPETPEPEAFPPLPTIPAEPGQWPVESAGASPISSGGEPAAPSAATAGAGDIPDRLERIARALRTGTPLELLSGATDPLEVLIVGYALGASQGRGGRSGGRGSPS